MELLVRNKVADYGRWRRLFDEQGEAARAAGLSLRQLWRSVDDPNDVFFLFEVEDRCMRRRRRPSGKPPEWSTASTTS